MLKLKAKFIKFYMQDDLDNMLYVWLKYVNNYIY